MSTRSGGTWRTLKNSPFNVPASTLPVEHFATDDRVSHDRHGLGTVVGEESGGVLVKFGTDVRRLALPNPKLTKL